MIRPQQRGFGLLARTFFGGAVKVYSQLHKIRHDLKPILIGIDQGKRAEEGD
jgi:hypothetical protein